MMKLFDYTLYDELHQSLVAYYGSETKLRFAVAKEKSPARSWRMMTVATHKATAAMRDFNAAVGEAAKATSMIEIKPPRISRR